MKLIVGLGNPGKEYVNTRHNAGFLALNTIFSPSREGEQEGVVWRFEKKFNAELAEMKIGKEKVLLARPQTFMNKSGEAIGALRWFYKIKPRDIIVIHDELDLPLGRLRIKIGGSSAGHKGLESIIKALGTPDFIRLRLGIAPASRRVSAEKFVLGAISPSEIKKLKPMFESLGAILTVIFTESLEKAMSLYNR